MSSIPNLNELVAFYLGGANNSQTLPTTNPPRDDNQVPAHVKPTPTSVAPSKPGLYDLIRPIDQFTLAHIDGNPTNPLMVRGFFWSKPPLGAALPPANASPDSTSLLNESRCVICFEEFQADSRIMVLPCNHYYHGQCWTEWCKQSCTCPTCRAGFKWELVRK